MQRYFANISPQETIVLPKDPAHHLVKVMRAKIGTEIELVLADHCVYRAVLTETAPEVKLQITKRLTINSELPVSVVLACGIPKTKEKPELIVQKATEMGADKIVFFDAARSISHWQENKRERKITRLQKIAKSAAEQSHRNKVPEIKYCDNLDQLLDRYQTTKRVVAWEESAKQGETSALSQQFQRLRTGDSILAIFGPEGGLTSEEVMKMNSAGVISVGLGPRILRTETAPLYFMAAISYATELL
ncbi:16S rRNA (uracil(1498)-N(3))-methyltransferase [Limosilactobacillus sp. STM2_1]|uniref:Ribosomal RNA small subunit methyltransferase E n=1 Tax=Limosilactobacillus rudii TaxID=2759755 RepID=A0A7W3YMV0_9LACO|nr:16S rRNA (uracil(1498)-N(3))-methyltransferase [Limosilactobacillus rudii]MBB1078349.1 16S rRNA (uracil(1498)-N(3))-methyltransferase [Limosilactobacillus rudii]MBB1096945.1 16S rRNA (uracil(1498)-N(3))-methyltransferase [Limosilactobacillus rudii]MCD7134055.1 16S rRNA (uracil(1498)-N(3))-methyltransferase [Limosilactobacillus rudii]